MMTREQSVAYSLPAARGDQGPVPGRYTAEIAGLVLDKVRSSGEFAEGVVIAMIDAIMGAAIEFIQSSRQLAKSTNLNSIG